MRSKLDRQGEIMIDHRNSPGLTPEWAAANGVTGPIVGGGDLYRSGIKNCRHCGSDVLMNPMRKRPREWCRKCDAYICENCGLLRKLGGYEHMTAEEHVTDIFNRYQRSF
jgi:hypothetical protein